jgi:primosomal protein N' (replication factor Y)
MTKIYLLNIVILDQLPSNTPDYFTYFSTNYIKKFSFVKVDFKGRIKVGLVIDIKPIVKSEVKRLDFALKNIKEFIRPGFISEIQEKLAYWISKNYFISLSHAFCFFTNFYKKIENIEAEPKPEFSNKFKFLYFEKFDDKLIENPPILIITPTEELAKILNKKIENSYLIDLEVKKEKFSDLIRKILNKENLVFIGTKNSIFLPWQKLNSIIVLEEGSIFYKEHFKPPYFNYLNLIKKLAMLLKSKLILIDEFPSLETYVKLNLKNYPKFSFQKIEDIDELPKILENYEKSKIFIPTKSLAQKFYCSNCFYEFDCPKCNYPLTILENKLYCRVCFKEYEIPKNCPNCGSFDLSLKGIGGLWVKNFLERKGFFVVFINDESDIKNFLKKDYKRYVLIGSLYILNPLIPKTESAIFLNFDNAFYSWNIFLKEKNLRILKKLSNKANDIYVQTKFDDEILGKIKNGEIIKDIIDEREDNFLPPFSRIIKLVGRLKNLEELNKRLLQVKESLNNKKILFNKRIEISGPFLEKIPKRMKRYQMFLVLKLEDGVDLKKLLEDIKYIEEIRGDEEEI